jgi:hypothetical protein
MKYEIGSEFWEAAPLKSNIVYLMSGRTALEFIICDILKTHYINSVLLPSYCCHTMVEPFIRHNISVRFYDVFYDPKIGICADIPDYNKNEIFYYMTYFGFSEIHGINIEEIRNTYELIIEDRTHSAFIDKGVVIGDYSYLSYRKWTGFLGIASCEKTNGYFSDYPTDFGVKYCSLRKNAMQQKGIYINTGNANKEEFLALFNEAEELLETDYLSYSAPDECFRQLISCDFEAMKNIRRRNADFLIRELSGISGVQLIYSKRNDHDTPLFVPVLSKNRDALRKYLTENRIYCPTHWPLSDYHEDVNERGKSIYKEELSLVCDQRYDLDDMERIVKTIKDFFR